MNVHYDVHADDDQADRFTPLRLRQLRLGDYPLGHHESAGQLAAWLGQVADLVVEEAETSLANPVDDEDAQLMREGTIVLPFLLEDVRTIVRGLREAAAVLAAGRDGYHH